MSESLKREIYDQAYKTLRLGADLELTIKDCVEVLSKPIKMAETHPELTGSQKKQLVLDVLALIYETFGGDVRDFVFNSASFVIDQIIDVYNAGEKWMESTKKRKWMCC